MSVLTTADLFCIKYNHWFVALTIDDSVGDHLSFSANRDRFIENDVMGNLIEDVINPALQKELLSEDYFCVNGAYKRYGHHRKSLSTKKQMMVVEEVVVNMTLILE